MGRTKLTKSVLNRLLTPEKTLYLYDEDLPGLGLRVGSSGNKSWFFEYRVGAGGRSSIKRRVSIGSAAKFSPEQARKIASDQLARVRLGADPATERYAERESASLIELAETYMRQEVRPKLAKSTASTYEGMFRKHIFPALGTRKAKSITFLDIARLHGKIGEKRPATANRVVTLISGVYTYAAKRSPLFVGVNPTRGITHFPEHPKDRYLTSEELSRLGATLREAETIGLLWEGDKSKPKAKHIPREEKRREIYSPYATAAIRLLLLTGCRLREILHLRWDEVDFERGMLFLSTSKTGRKTVILNGSALRILHDLPRAGRYVILGSSPDVARSDLKRPWEMISKHAGLAGVRLHDLRHSFASVGAGASLGLPIIGKLLGHSQPQTTARYAHLDADPVRIATDIIGEKIANALGGG